MTKQQLRQIAERLSSSCNCPTCFSELKAGVLELLAEAEQLTEENARLRERLDHAAAFVKRNNP